MTWSEIKSLLAAMKPAAFKGIVNTTTGSTPEIALYARVTNGEISGNPYKFWWLLREYTLTLTGAADYNLRTLIPDLGRVYQVANALAPGREGASQPLREFNLSTGGSSSRFTVFGDTLRFGAPGTTGTVTIPYYSRWLVADASGVRKQDFTLDTDVSVIPEQHVMALVEGMKRFVNDKIEKEASMRTYMINGRPTQVEPFSFLLNQMILDDRPVHQVVLDFRYNPA